MIGHYENLSNEELEEIMPELIGVKNKLQKIEKDVISIFNEPSQEKIDELTEDINFIIDIGDRFRWEKFKKLDEKIKELGGDGKFFNIV